MFLTLQTLKTEASYHMDLSGKDQPELRSMVGKLQLYAVGLPAESWLLTETK